MTLAQARKWFIARLPMNENTCRTGSFRLRAVRA